MTGSVPSLRTSRHDVEGPLADLVDDRDATVWLRRGEGFVGRGAALRVDLGTGRERFQQAGDVVAALGAEAASGDAPPVAFASFTFDERSHGSVFVVPEVLVARRGGESWVSWTGDAAPELESIPEKDPPGDRVRYAGASIPDLLWLDAVATAVARIRGGELEKVVLARDHAVWSEASFSPRRLVRRLAEHFPGCFTFLVDGFIGASPELLVRRMGRSVTSEVLAGSAPRGDDAAADEGLGQALLHSEKDRSEHDLAVASVRDVLAGLCDDLEVDPEPRLTKLENVQHLATRVEGRLRAPSALPPTALEVVTALHPTAAVGGVPTAAAADAIRELERMDRGRYAGPVGWVDASGDGEFAIALRCAELSGARARLFAGSGIVAASLPEAELEETRLKLRAMQLALEP